MFTTPMRTPLPPLVISTAFSPDSSSSSSPGFSSPTSDALPTPLMPLERVGGSDVYIIDREEYSRHPSGPCHKIQGSDSSLDLVHFDTSYSLHAALDVIEKDQHLLLSTEAHSTDHPTDVQEGFDVHHYSEYFPQGHVLSQSFIDTYELGDELGSGGFGFVMTAQNRETGVEVAVKFIIKDKVPEHAWMYDEVMGLLPTEILLLSWIDHPNIVKCIDLFEDDVFFYMVQELHGSPWPKYRFSPVPALSPSTSEHSIEDSSPATPPSSLTPFPESQLLDVPVTKRPVCGRRPSHDLFECIEQSELKRIPEERAKYIFRQVVDAVVYLDSHGITHRDIKDENILIDRDFNVKLIDFGSAAIFDPDKPQPYHEAFFGTTAYAASEILLKKTYRAAPAEIWTLGVLLSYLLTGASPFPTSEDAIAGRIVLSCPRGTEEFSSHSLDLLRMCLHPNPRKRATIVDVSEHPWLH